MEVKNSEAVTKTFKKNLYIFPPEVKYNKTWSRILGSNFIKVIKVLYTKIVRFSTGENFCQNDGEKDLKASTNEINMVTLEGSYEEMICN